MNEYPYLKYQIIVMFFLVVLSITAVIFGMKSSIEKNTRIFKTQFNYWVKNLKKHNIHKITFVLDKEKRYVTQDHGDTWAKVIKMFVNNVEVNPDTVYGSGKLVLKHCDGNYYHKGHNRDIDSIIYQFYPDVKFYKHNYETNKFYRADLTYPDKKYSDKLPKCWDEE